MKTLTHVYDQVKFYVAITPGEAKVEAFIDYAAAFAYVQQVLATTGRNVCVEPVY
jgi:hypothetical protein